MQSVDLGIDIAKRALDLATPNCYLGQFAIPVVNELVLLLVYAATCFRPPMRLQRGQNHTRWV